MNSKKELQALDDKFFPQRARHVLFRLSRYLKDRDRDAEEGKKGNKSKVKV
ncbi:MAG: hypothetical protein HQ594_04070 [Candidatus Omnitrophica bacterium]|nr:hypothetical protein [Candidatus Omnitrophota bacterium]